MKKDVRRILLTGSSGQVGWELKRALMQLGEVIAPDRGQFDLARPKSLRKKIAEWKPDLIVNPAAYTAVDQAEAESKLVFAINAESPAIMAEEAEKLNIPMVHYSTDYVFDGTKQTPYTEEDKPNPLNVYGESKLQGDLLIQKVTGQHLILRTSWIYSLRGNNFLNTMLKLFNEWDKVDIVDDQYGTPSWARYIAQSSTEMIARLILEKNRGSYNRWGIYNLTASGEASWYDFAEAIYKNSHNKFNVKLNRIHSSDFKSNSLRPLFTVLDNNKLKSEWGLTSDDWIGHLSLCLEDSNTNM
jgi:dTDP-4-dehydrorhamnose reductase